MALGTSYCQSSTIRNPHTLVFAYQKSRKWLCQGISYKFDKMLSTSKGYNKMKSRVFSKGVAMMMSDNQQDDEDGPFKEGWKSERKYSCPDEESLEELLNEFEDEYGAESNSLPAIPLCVENQTEKDSTEKENKTRRLPSAGAPSMRRHSNFLMKAADSNKGISF